MRTNNNIALFSNATAARANVIAIRTEDNMMGLIKAQMIDLLKEKMAHGVAHFIFAKKDGSLREAWGIIQRNIAKAKINGRGASRENFATTAYFDVECGAWRSFRWESLVKVF